MKFKNLLLTLSCFFLALSCNNSSHKNDTPSIEANDIIATEEKTFSITNIERTEFLVDSDDRATHINYYHRNPELNEMFATLIFEIKMKNETLNKITSFDVEGYIEATFEDGEELRLPTHSGGMYFSDASKEKIWQPNSIHKLKFWYLGIDRNRRTMDLRVSKFERTPVQCDFVFHYKAISVDGEYADEERFNILEQWRDFQGKVGLR